MIFPVLSETLAILKKEDCGDKDHSGHRASSSTWLDLGWDTKCATVARQVEMCLRSLTLSAELRQKPTFSDYKIADLFLKHVGFPLTSEVPTYSMIL